MYRTARRGLAIVASAAALLTAVAACSSSTNSPNTPKADVPGVTDTSILVGTHQPLTGPASGGYSKISPATKAYFDYINSKGGVNGRKITYKIVDDTYNPATTQTVVRDLVQRDKVFAVLNGLGTPTHTGVLDFLKSNKVPDLFVASGSKSWNQPSKYPNTFAFNPDYVTGGKILGSYVKKTFPDKKVCHFGQADDFGADSLSGVEKGLGAAVAAKQTYVTSNQNVGPQIGAFKAAGCGVIITAAIPGFVALAIGTAAALGFFPQWVADGVGGDYLTLSSYLKDKTPLLLQNFISAGYLPGATEVDNDWIKLYKQINKTYNNDAPFDNNIVYGMSVGYLFVQALTSAGKDLTRESLMAAITKNGFTGPGLVPLLYSGTSHAGYAGVRLTKVDKGVQSYFGDTYTSDQADGPVVTYTGTSATAPAF